MAVVTIAKTRRKELVDELLIRYSKLKAILNAAKTGENEYAIDSLDLQFAVSDFETILKQIKGLK